MLTHNHIQTNHGVSYPVVGPNRTEQEELASADDPPLKDGSEDPSHPTVSKHPANVGRERGEGE